jgi:prevent-host-death family protein
VREITATEAARKFADLLDAIEHRGERFTIVRRGRPVAQLAPASSGHGRAVKAMLDRHRPDPRWRRDLADLRAAVVFQERP